jgi:hypothetical protein
MSLDGLLKRCRDEDEEAWFQFDALVREIARRVLLPAWKFDGLSRAEKDEAVGEVRLRLVDIVRKNRILGTTDGEIASYIRAALQNQARDQLKKRRELLESELEAQRELRRVEPGDSAPSAEIVTAHRLRLDAVLEEVQSWPLSDRIIFFGKLYQVSSKSIKRQLEEHRIYIDVGTVDTRHRRLRDKLTARFPGT